MEPIIIRERFPSYVNDSLIRERFLSKNRPKKHKNKNFPPRNLHSKRDDYFVGTQKPLKISDYFETKQELRFYQKRSSFVAEKEGFEPSRRLSQPTPLAGEPLRPLGYFSVPDFRCQNILSHPPRVVNPFYRKISRMTAIAPSISLGVRNGERLSRTVPVSSVPPLSCAVGAQ